MYTVATWSRAKGVIQRGCPTGQPLLFQPLAKWRDDYKLDMEDTLLTSKADGRALLVTNNYEHSTIKLAGGDDLGEMRNSLL